MYISVDSTSRITSATLVLHSGIVTEKSQVVFLLDVTLTIVISLWL